MPPHHRTAVSTPHSPRPLPQFSQAIKHHGIVYCSGNIGLDPRTGQLVSGTVADRTRQALRNLAAVLAAAGSGLDRVIKANVFLVNMDDFAALNEAWDDFFPDDPKPVSNQSPLSPRSTPQRAASAPSSRLLSSFPFPWSLSTRLTKCHQCRTCVAVRQLPLGTDVEIEMMASYEEISKL